jgi:Tol biopolymer transport system component
MMLVLAAVSVPLGQQGRVNGGLPAVSSDGRHIAFWGDRGAGAQFFVIDADGSHEVQVTRGSQDHGRPAWSPDGKRIVYCETANNVGPSMIFEVGPRGTDAAQVGAVQGRSPVLMHDRQHVLFVSGGWNDAQLSVSRLDGTDVHRISDGTAATWNPALSPDGRQVAYTRSEPGQIGVWVMNVDGSDPRAVTHFTRAEGRAQVPAWSPDGKRIAFQASAPSAGDSTKSAAHIWIVELATGKLTKLAPHDEPYLDEGPAWFPDGRSLAFQSTRSGRMEVWVMRSDGTAPRQVTGR